MSSSPDQRYPNDCRQDGGRREFDGRGPYESSRDRDHHARYNKYMYEEERRSAGNYDNRSGRNNYDDHRSDRRSSYEDERRRGYDYEDHRSGRNSRRFEEDRDRRSYSGGRGNDHRDSSNHRSNHRDNNRNFQAPVLPKYYVAEQPKDENLPPDTQKDPRGDDPSKRITKKANSRGAGRNTESFDPATTLVRPDVRVLVGNPNLEKYNKPLKHDDVVIVPELFGPEDNWETYYQLVKELTELQKQEQESNKNKKTNGSEFISWHEGAHLICKSPQQSPKFKEIVAKLCAYFNIDDSSAGTRFNWYKDSSDWKPFHHDSAAFNPKRAKSQNITVGVSFGATRELAFIRAGENGNNNGAGSGQPPARMYFPQTNNGVFTFGRDVNIRWKHGVNALTPAEQDGRGRISIILWGLARDVIDEDNSPPLLGADGQGPHANHNHSHPNKKRRRNRNNNHGSGGGDGNDRK